MKFHKLVNQTAVGLLFFSSSLFSAIQIIQPSDNAYEEIKAKTRGQSIDKNSYLSIVNDLNISDKSKDKLIKLTPLNYLGIADKLAKS